MLLPPWRVSGPEVFLLLSSFAYCSSLCQPQGKDAVRIRKLREGWEFPGWSPSSLELLTD